MDSSEVRIPAPKLSVPCTGSMIFHYTPEYISEINGRIPGDRPWPQNKTIIHTGGLGDVSARSIPWPVKDFTRFDPTGNPGDFQKGVAEDFYGSSAVQLQGYTAGMHIHSYSSPTSGIYKLAQVAYAWEQNVFPWKYGGKANLCMSYYAAVPNSWTGDGSINYSYIAAAVRDMSTGKVLWIAMIHYDSRGEDGFYEGPVWWEEQNTAIAVGYYGGQRYSSLIPTSYRSTGKTWNNWRYYGCGISQGQLQAMVNDINDRYDLKFSTSPDEYRLELFGVGPEMTVTGGKQGHMSMKVKEIWIFTWVNETQLARAPEEKPVQAWLRRVSLGFRVLRTDGPSALRKEIRRYIRWRMSQF